MADAARLTALRTAYSDLVSGQSVARLRDQNGEEIQYGRADRESLAALIRKEERECDDGALGSVGPLRMLY